MAPPQGNGRTRRREERYLNPPGSDEGIVYIPVNQGDCAARQGFALPPETQSLSSMKVKASSPNLQQLDLNKVRNAKRISRSRIPSPHITAKEFIYYRLESFGTKIVKPNSGNGNTFVAA